MATTTQSSGVVATATAAAAADRPIDRLRCEQMNQTSGARVERVNAISMDTHAHSWTRDETVVVDVVVVAEFEWCAFVVVAKVNSATI